MMQVSAEQLPLQRIYHWEKVRRDKPYFTQPMGQGAVREWTWGQAVDESRRMAAFLREQGRIRGWEPGARIAIISKNCAYWIMVDFAIWMAGYASVPLYPTLTGESVRQILEHSEARAVFIGKLDAWNTMKHGIPGNVLRISTPLSPADAADGSEEWGQIIARTAAISDSPVRPGDEMATIIYTSGTTGMPKGVMHSFQNFSATSRTMGEVFGLGAEERILSYLPLAHVAERVGVEGNSLYLGFRVFFAESLDTFLQDLQIARPTIFFSVPRLWVKFQQGVFSKMPKRKLDRLMRIPLLGRMVKQKILRQLGFDQVRFASTGAAPLPAEVIAWYRSLGLDLLEVYGMTENMALSHTNRPDTVRVGYVGTPWPHVECRLSETGEVLIRAPWNMLGYYKEPEKTRESFTADGFLKTGDVGEIDTQGRLKITGRAKEQFKTSKGKYVAPAPIENKLGTHPQIEAVCVAGANYPRPFAMLMLPAEVALGAAAHPEQRRSLTEALSTHLESVNAVLDPHEQLAFVAVVPEQWTVDNGFVTPTMKIKRAAVEAAYGPFFDAWSASKLPVIWHA